MEIPLTINLCVFDLRKGLAFAFGDAFARGVIGASHGGRLARLSFLGGF